VIDAGYLALMRPVLAICAGALALAAAPAVASAQTQPDTTPSVAADGVGFATLTPDIADFTVAVRETGRSSAAARGAANRIVATVIRIAAAAGVAGDDIRTIGLTISRTRVKPKRKPAYIRYNARQYLQLRVRQVAKLGPLLDAVADAGADAVEAPDFGFADPSAGRLLATRAALADARRRADDAAAATGLRITGVRSVVLSPDDDEDCCDDSGAKSQQTASSETTSVSPGTQQFSERVRVVYTAAPV
jgi:uncharacterized protein YggE